MRKIQDAQRKKKDDEKEKHKEKSMEGMRRKQALSSYAQNEEDADEKEDDDAEYYREEVGQEPEKGTSPSTNSIMVYILQPFSSFILLQICFLPESRVLGNLLCRALQPKGLKLKRRRCRRKKARVPRDSSQTKTSGMMTTGRTIKGVISRLAAAIKTSSDRLVEDRHPTKRRLGSKERLKYSVNVD